MPVDSTACGNHEGTSSFPSSVPASSGAAAPPACATANHPACRVGGGTGTELPRHPINLRYNDISCKVSLPKSHHPWRLPCTGLIWSCKTECRFCHWFKRKTDQKDASNFHNVCSMVYCCTKLHTEAIIYSICIWIWRELGKEAAAQLCSIVERFGHVCSFYEKQIWMGRNALSLPMIYLSICCCNFCHFLSIKLLSEYLPQSRNSAVKAKWEQPANYWHSTFPPFIHPWVCCFCGALSYSYAHLVDGLPLSCTQPMAGVGTVWPLRSLPTQSILWFCGTIFILTGKKESAFRNCELSHNSGRIKRQRGNVSNKWRTISFLLWTEPSPLKEINLLLC